MKNIQTASDFGSGVNSSVILLNVATNDYHMKDSQDVAMSLAETFDNDKQEKGWTYYPFFFDNQHGATLGNWVCLKD